MFLAPSFIQVSIIVILQIDNLVAPLGIVEVVPSCFMLESKAPELTTLVNSAKSSKFKFPPIVLNDLLS